MNSGTRIRTALAIAVALYTAFLKTDVADFGNDTVNLIYQICMKAVTFVVIFLITWYNNDFTEVANKYTAEMRAEKERLKLEDIEDGEEMEDLYDEVTIPETEEEGDDDGASD